MVLAKQGGGGDSMKRLGYWVYLAVCALARLFFPRPELEGLENLPEGGERCFKCYRLRLEESAKAAAERGFEYFTTTLSVSPYKNAQKLNLIGMEFAEKYGVKYLCSDFKKKNGYHRSIELSAQYGLYRQNYCGCVYSAQQSCAKRIENNE